jgi:hypothetical protein
MNHPISPNEVLLVKCASEIDWASFELSWMIMDTSAAVARQAKTPIHSGGHVLYHSLQDFLDDPGGTRHALDSPCVP